MVKRIFKRSCERPPVPRNDKEFEDMARTASFIQLPEKSLVQNRINNIVKNKMVRTVLLTLLDTIYELPEDHYFIKWLKVNAWRYKIYNKKKWMVDFLAVSTLSFIDYCNDQAKNSIEEISSEEDLAFEDRYCNAVKIILNELRNMASTMDYNKRKLIKDAMVWKRETGKLVKLWDRIEREWCRHAT